MGGGISTSHQKLSENVFTDVFVERHGFLKEEGVWLMRMDTTSSIFSFLEVVVVVVIRCGCRRSVLLKLGNHFSF